MRTETITRTIYTVEELQQQCPAAFKVALRRHERMTYEDPDQGSDDWASLKALDDITGYRRSDRAWLDRESMGEQADLKGARAMSWLENVVLGPLRVPWAPFTGTNRQFHAKCGERPGTIPSCPLTGYCIDNDLLDSLQDAIAQGLTVSNAMHFLTAVVEKGVATEVEYQASEEGFLDWADRNEVEFYEDGTQV